MPVALEADEPPQPWGRLEQINAFRSRAGVPPANLNPALVQSAAGHVGYYDLNRGDPALAGMGLHEQRPGAPGFTGASIGARARGAGYTAGSVTENSAFGGLEGAIEWAMNTVNHRLPLIHPSALDLGFAESDLTGFSIIDVGLRRIPVGGPSPSVYPWDGATDVPRSWDGGEAPDPAPGVRRPLGYPITVAFSIQQRVEWRTLELRGPEGEPLEISTARTDWMRAAAIIPHRPLQPGQTYTARVEALIDGRPVARDWSFTTAG